MESILAKLPKEGNSLNEATFSINYPLPNEVETMKSFDDYMTT